MSVDHIVVAYGDGVGPEIMEAVLKVMRHAEMGLGIKVIQVGEKKYKEGWETGIPDSAWKEIKSSKVLLKSPITTPQGGGCRSLNVTLRKNLGLYANIRPCISYYPLVDTKCHQMNLVIIRENEEDIYSGIEYSHTSDSFESLKLISRTGSERICKYAFRYAEKYGRKKITCMSKDNIMKMTDGVFHRTFDEVAAKHPDIKNEHYIIDIGSARIASDSGAFDVIVTENLYGDIISDIAAEISGSVGMAGSSNIGTEYAMFEAIHGSAPDIAGKDIANPSALLHAAIQMLVHVNKIDVAANVHNAWLKTIEDGIHTADIYSEHKSTKKVGTEEFANTVIANLGKDPSHFEKVVYHSDDRCQLDDLVDPVIIKREKKLFGADICIDWEAKDVDGLGDRFKEFSQEIAELGLSFKAIFSKGLRIYPAVSNIIKNCSSSDLLCCRFCSVNINQLAKDVNEYDESKLIVSHDSLNKLLVLLDKKLLLDVVKVDKLYSFNGEPGYFATS